MNSSEASDSHEMQQPLLPSHAQNEPTVNGNGQEEILGIEDEIEAGRYGLCSLTEFATWLDIGSYVVGVLAAVVFGTILPYQSVIIGRIYSGLAGIDNKELHKNILENIPSLLYLGVVAFFSGYIQYACLVGTSERVVKRVRVACMKSLLSQEVAYYETHSTGKLTTILTDQSQILLRGLAESIGATINFLSQMVSGFVIAFLMSYKVALGMLLVVPVNSILVGLLIYTIMSRVQKLNNNNEGAGGFAEEILSAMPTVASMCGEEKAISRYNAFLKVSDALTVVICKIRGVGVGSIYAFVFVSYGLGFWFGSIEVSAMDASFGDVLSAVFSCILGSIAIAVAFPNINAVIEAKVSAGKLMNIVKRKPKLDSNLDGAQTGNGSDGSIKGDIEFNNVSFSYMGRTQKVLGGVSFKVEPGKTCALVGNSGCGKSTIISLLERFYNPDSGVILIDGRPIDAYSLEFLRSQVALVSQEPILFDTSIHENILMGKAGVFSLETEEFDEEIVMAAKQANAHTFIEEFARGYETSCGSRGTQLSGGQKQRIALARALIRKPKILLLDEATSALDNESEKVVQAAIDRLLEKKQVTSIVVAHRLSTIRNADQIVVFDPNQGQGSTVVEIGTHDELLERPNGKYRDLVRAGGQEVLRTSTSDCRQKRHHASSFELSDDTGFNVRDLTRTSSTLSGLSGLINKDYAGLHDLEESDEIGDVPVDPARVWKMNRKELPFFIIGTVGASLKGASQPMMSIIMAELLGSFFVAPVPLLNLGCGPGGKPCPDGKRCFNFEPIIKVFLPTFANLTDGLYCYESYFIGYSPNDVRHSGLEALWVYSLLGFIVGFGLCVSVFCFGYAGGKLTRRLKSTVFQSLCTQDMSFFDNPKHHVGILLGRLSNDSILVQNATGDYLGLMVENSVALVVAAIIAFCSSWRMSSVVFVPCCLLIYSSYQDNRRISAFSRKQVMDKQSDKLINQSLRSVRTIYSCTAEDKVLDMFEESLSGPSKAGIKGGMIMGLQTGISQCMYQLIYSFAFWYGALLLQKQEIDSKSLSRVFFVVSISATFIGASLARANDLAKADAAITNLFALIDRRSPIDYSNENGERRAISGHIVFKDIRFSYPSRPECLVLKRFSCEIKPGEIVAFVGRSGCGKSSIIRLLERFYDLNDCRSSIRIDGVDIREFNVHFLRSSMGLVSQEPILFHGTIFENVTYGLEGEVDKQAVIEACKMAAAHDFIEAFPDKYDTLVNRGLSLSGGQKQRISIARALIKDPSILMLDEATSALDNESEKSVQMALDHLIATKKRTTLIVAHRLSTIRHADKILVLDNGKVAEEGSHDELICLPNGRYKSLYENQPQS